MAPSVEGGRPSVPEPFHAPRPKPRVEQTDLPARDLEVVRLVEVPEEQDVGVAVVRCAAEATLAVGTDRPFGQRAAMRRVGLRELGRRRGRRGDGGRRR